MKKIIIIAALLACTSTCIAQDKWQPNPKYVKTQKSDTVKHKSSFQCWGTTQKGQRCKRHVSTEHGYCYQHIGQK